MKDKLLLSILLILFISISVFAQQTFNLEDYVSSNPGDRWQYKNLDPDENTPIVFTISEEQVVSGVKTFKRARSNGDYRLQTIDKKGLKVYQLYLNDNRKIEYEKAIRLLPAKLKSGSTYRSEAQYKYFEKDQAKDTGTQTYTVKLVGTEDVTINGKTFEKCLLITTRAKRTDSSGEVEEGYLLREWYAKGIGAVKIIGTYYWNDREGKRTKTSYINAELERAKIADKEIDLTK